jgi:glycosyltransferase involved in cell wall biosynthesis
MSATPTSEAAPSRRPGVLPARGQALRIAYVTETYPPEINGVANTVQRAVRWLRERGHALQLVRPRQAIDAASPARPPCEGGAGHELLTSGMPIPMYPELRLGLARPAALVHAWRHARPDLVHIATEGPLGWAALRAARRLGVPASSDFRTNFHLYSAHYGFGLVQPVALAYLRWFHNSTRLTTVPTRALRATLEGAGFRNLAVVGRGVDTRQFSPAWRSESLRRSWGAGHNEPVALYVGRLAPEKNVALVLRAWDAMRARVANARLVLVGDGPQRARLAAARPDAVFTGWQRGEDLARCYASADVFLFPSMTETFGNVVVEALASGLAVVAYAHGAAGEHLREGASGLLAGLGAEDAFVAQAVRAVSDPVLRARVREGACSTAQSLGWDTILEGLERAFIRAARASRAPDQAAYASSPR